MSPSPEWSENTEDGRRSHSSDAVPKTWVAEEPGVGDQDLEVAGEAATNGARSCSFRFVGSW